jgi:hypothetical protein
MGPFGLPWSTFGAVLVIVASVIISIIWAVFCSGSNGGPHE